jgi:hypothetical protein
MMASTKKCWCPCKDEAQSKNPRVTKKKDNVDECPREVAVTCILSYTGDISRSIVSKASSGQK